MAPLYTVRKRARASFALLALTLLLAAIAPGLAEAAGHGPEGQADTDSEARPGKPRPDSGDGLAKGGNGQGSGGNASGNGPRPGHAHTNGSGSGNGNGNGNGTPGQDQGSSDDDDGNGNGQGSRPGNDDGQTSTTPDQGSSSTPASAADRPVAAPAPPVTVPTAVADPVTAPQRQSSTRATQRGDGEGRNGRSTVGGSSGGRAAGTAPGADSGAAEGASGGSAGDAPDGGTGGAGGAEAGQDSSDGAKKRSGSGEGSPVTRTVTRTVRDIIEVVPDSAKMALAALAALAVLLGFGYLLTALRARRLGGQRRELLQEVGLLQGALLPEVPEAIGSVRTSVAYRPADGPAAGGDFYDVLPLSGGRVGFILGDISGHGHEALQRTAFMRYTLRAYLEAGLEPRAALQVAGRVIDDNLGGDFATVLLAVHDPDSGSLTYASAGHPGPIVIGNGREHEPVTVASSPPIGIGERTGLRQTTVPLTHGSIACLFTDGLTEARTEEGILGRWRLQKLLKELGPDAEGQQLLERVAAEARAVSDDMATCLIAPKEGVTAGGFETEQLELTGREPEGPLAQAFLAACKLPEAEVERAVREARGVAGQFGGVVLHVVLGNRRTVEVLPRNVESIDAASRRMAAVG